MMRDNGYIEVHIQVGPFPDRAHDCTVRMDLSESIMERALQPLDHPSPDAGILHLICTPMDTIQEVRRRRADVADFLGAEIKRAILKAMAAKDTKMGYPICDHKMPLEKM